MKTLNNTENGTIQVDWQENASPFKTLKFRLTKKQYSAEELVEQVNSEEAKK